MIIVVRTTVLLEVKDAIMCIPTVLNEACRRAGIRILSVLLNNQV
jgi:hypothetical protein